MKSKIFLLTIVVAGLCGCQDPPKTMRPFQGFPDGTEFAPSTPDDDETQELTATPSGEIICVLNAGEKETYGYFNSNGYTFGYTVEAMTNISSFQTKYYVDVLVEYYFDHYQKWFKQTSTSVAVAEAGDGKVNTVGANGSATEVIQNRITIQTADGSPAPYPIRVIGFQRGAY